MSRLEELIEKCRAYANEQPYCWFRISFAKIGKVEPGWVAWFEYSGTSSIAGVGDTLLKALEDLWNKK